MTEPEAAEFLRVSLSKLKRKRAARKVPHYYDGRSVRYSRTALLRYIEESIVANMPIEPAPSKYRRAGHRSVKNQRAILDLI
ncbi:helix-turn-helix domain-containing protein [Ruegeria arenilitoris]|uniref:helix-turn-helix domain-containing protein n=1 Tax=Ruegeria arenilitoris TaxID=1173585 RepID=UPI003464D816